MNPRDPLWHLPTRPRVANLIDELPDDFGDYAASQQVRGYLRRLSEHGIVGPGHGDPVPRIVLTGPGLKTLLRAAYLDGRRDEEEDAKLRQVFAAVADALPPVDHEAEARLEVTLAEHCAAEVKRSLR